MDRYECQVCGYVHDPEVGDSVGGIPPGVPFEGCPMTGAAPSPGRQGTGSS